MHIRSFTAPTMAEAMAKIRQELGDEAMIVSTETGRRGKGFYVQAAVDKDEDDIDYSQAPEPTTDSENDDTPLTIRAHLLRRLAYHGIPERPGLRLIQSAEQSGEETPHAALAAALAHRYDFRPIALEGQKPVMLVGPAGAGKSVTIAKMATRATLRGIRFRLITADTVRAGAVAQLQAYADLLQCPLQFAESPEAMLEAVDTDDTPVLIDTAGVNPYAPESMQQLRDLLCRHDHIEPILTLPAGCDVEEAADIAGAFARIGCQRMIATRLDCARRFGGLITAAEIGGLAFTAVGTGADVATGLQPLNADALSRLLLDEAQCLNRFPTEGEDRS